MKLVWQADLLTKSFHPRIATKQGEFRFIEDVPAAGIFYDFLVSTNLNPERALLGPPGLGLQNIAGRSIRNPLPNIAGVAVGTPLDFRGSPTLFTGADLMAILSATAPASRKASPTPATLRCAPSRSRSKQLPPH